MTPEQIAWLAGLLEGEGCFGLAHLRGLTYPKITVQMTDRDVVARAALLFGGSAVMVVQPKATQLGRKIGYACQVQGYRAVVLMRLLRPFIGERRRAKIDELIAGYAPRRRGSAWDRRCIVAGCSVLHSARGMCRRHYGAWRYQTYVKARRQQRRAA